MIFTHSLHYKKNNSETYQFAIKDNRFGVSEINRSITEMVLPYDVKDER